MKLTARTGDRVLDIEIRRSGGIYTVEMEGKTRQVDVHKLEGDFYSMLMEHKSYEISIESHGSGYLVRHGASARRVDFTDPSRGGREGFVSAAGPQEILAEMPGKIVRVLVAEGDAVIKGQGLVVLEAMKMENEVAALRDGKVKQVSVVTGQTVESGVVLLVVE